MHVKSIKLPKKFKRFAHLQIEDIPESAQFVVVVGPNGSGKSSIIEAISLWHTLHNGRTARSGLRQDPEYLFQSGHESDAHVQGRYGRLVEINFHENLPTDPVALSGLLSVRSAYRNTANLSVRQLNAVEPIAKQPNVDSMTSNDDQIRHHYSRLASKAFEQFYSGDDDHRSVAEARNEHLAPLNRALQLVFPYLELVSFGRPPQDGTFVFRKSSGGEFKFKNLSAGEREVFDLILDVYVLSIENAAHLICIDEPEAHMSIDAQSKIIPALEQLLPANAQMWIATHSPGLISQVRTDARDNPGKYCFIDVGEIDPGQPSTIRPVQTASKFWQRAIGYVLGDLGGSVGPERVILCEGDDSLQASPDAANFDSRILSSIFGEDYPSVAFVSVGGGSDIRKAKNLASAISSEATAQGLHDRDNKTPEQIQAIKDDGDLVLSRREIENYLLCDEILRRLVEDNTSAPEDVDDRVNALMEILNRESTGASADDVKARARDLFRQIPKILPELQQFGSSHYRLLTDVLPRYVTPETDSYQQLVADLQLS